MTQNYNDFFGDSQYDFCLNLGELQQLQKESGIGCITLLDRLQNRLWEVGDISLIIRLSLIGAGMDAEKAAGLVKFYIEEKNRYIPHVQLATVILISALVGEGEIDGENVDKSVAEANDFLAKKQAAGIRQMPLKIASVRYKTDQYALMS